MNKILSIMCMFLVSIFNAHSTLAADGGTCTVRFTFPEAGKKVVKTKNDPVNCAKTSSNKKLVFGILNKYFKPASIYRNATRGNPSFCGPCDPKGSNLAGWKKKYVRVKVDTMYGPMTRTSKFKNRKEHKVHIGRCECSRGGKRSYYPKKGASWAELKPKFSSFD